MNDLSIPRRAVEILGKLVSFDTTSSKSNLALIDYVEGYLAERGVASRRIHNADRTKANLLATLGRGTSGGIVLSGHTDVVPVTGQDWSSEPFRMVERGGRLFGRGTADMKAFIAIALAAVPEFQERELARPVHFAFSYDEEIGCLGAPDLIRHLAEEGYTPHAAIVGEPTNMAVVDSHKGIDVYRVTVTGKEAHSSLTHHGVSANMVAIELMAVLSDIAARETAHRDERFEPQWSTLTVGTIHGGTAPNILARECRFAFDLRCIPARTPAEVLKPFHEAVARTQALLSAHGDGVGVAVERLASVPSLRQEAGGSAESLSARLTEVQSPTAAVPYAAEAGQFQQAGISTAICGPGSIVQAHRPDEYIELSQIDAGARFMQRLADYLRA